jgi:hypothetical protein
VKGGVVQYGRRAYPILFRIGGGGGTRQELDSCGPQRWTRSALLDLRLFVPLEVYDVPALGLGWVWFDVVVSFEEDID